MLDISTKWMCKIFGHNNILIDHIGGLSNIGGRSKCIRCGHITPAIKWPRPEKKENNNGK